MVSEAFIINTVTIITLLILVVTFLLPKKIRYAVHGIILLVLGLIPILYSAGFINFTFGEAGIIKYVVAVVVVFTARSLIIEGIHEESKIKYVSIIMGILIILLTAIPALHKLGALTFTIPEYPPMIDYIVYIIAAILLFIGIFIAED